MRSRALAQMCTVLTERSWDDLDALVTKKFESDPAVRELVESLSDEEAQDT